MADESIDLRFLAEQGKRILEELAEARSERAEMRAEQERLASMLGKVTDAVTQIATTQDHHGQVLERHSAILEHHSGMLDKLYEIQQNNGARLAAIDGRLAIIERHTGLIKA